MVFSLGLCYKFINIDILAAWTTPLDNQHFGTITISRWRRISVHFPANRLMVSDNFFHREII